MSMHSTGAASSTLAGEELGPVDKLEAALVSVSRRAMQYEQQMKDLEAKLAEDLSNSRAINTILSEVVQGLEHTKKRSDAALATVPYIAHALEDDQQALEELREQLPEIGDQVRHIREVYDRGRDKAKELVDALEWLNTPVPLRLRAIIFTSNAPVSSRWKALIRLLFALVFLTCMWIAWITIRGAMRAHRQRLVWGERLMS